MPKPEKGASHEVVLESRHLLGIFFLAVILAAFFFSMGYFLGRSQGAGERAATPPAQAQPATNPGGQPPTDLSFYERVESKPRPAAQPAPPAETPEKPSPAPAAGQPAQRIFLQVAAVSQESEAKRLGKKLEDLGFPSVIRPPEGDHLFRVQVGPFGSAELADAAARRLQAQGFTDIVRR